MQVSLNHFHLKDLVVIGLVIHQRKGDLERNKHCSTIKHIQVIELEIRTSLVRIN